MSSTDQRTGDRATLDCLERQLRRLAFDLHDGPAQTVGAAQLILDVLANRLGRDSSCDEIASLRELLCQTQDSLREMAGELRPASLDQGDLVSMVEHYLAGLKDRSDAQLSMTVHGSQQTLTPSARIAIFRIIQESLVNALKHGRAGEVSVDLEFERDVVVCIVRDDGCGFEPDSLSLEDHPSQLGLPGMAERAELLGGDILVASTPGEGTTVTTRIPIWK